MTEVQKQAIIDSGKDYFRTIIIPSHLKNLKKLRLKDFDVNPFLINYLAAFLCGNTKPESLAKALVYPRILGTSISTSFGQNIQVFISQVSEITGNASGIDGVDIEFIDAIDGRRKYCICVSSINGVKELSTLLEICKKTTCQVDEENWLEIADDVVVGVMFGEKDQLGKEYKTLEKVHPILCGSEFWEHLTGDKDVYNQMLLEFYKTMEKEHLYEDLIADIVKKFRAA